MMIMLRNLGTQPMISRCYEAKSMSMYMRCRVIYSCVRIRGKMGCALGSFPNFVASQYDDDGLMRVVFCIVYCIIETIFVELWKILWLPWPMTLKIRKFSPTRSMNL